MLQRTVTDQHYLERTASLDLQFGKLAEGPERARAQLVHVLDDEQRRFMVGRLLQGEYPDQTEHLVW